MAEWLWGIPDIWSESSPQWCWVPAGEWCAHM